MTQFLCKIEDLRSKKMNVVFLFLISVKSTYLPSTPPPPPLTLYKVPLRETIPETLTPNQPSIVVTKVSLKTFNHSTLFVSPTLSSK